MHIIKLKDLARHLHELKGLRNESSWGFFGAGLSSEERSKRMQGAIKQRESILARALGALDLGLVWDAERRMYTVYDLDSVEEGETPDAAVQ